MNRFTKSQHVWSFIIKTMIVFGAAIGLFATFMSSNFMRTHAIFYYTIQSNIWIAAVCFIIWIYDLVSLFKGKSVPIPNWLRNLKFIFTVAIVLTGLMFNFVLYPQSMMTGEPANPFSFSNFLTHIFVPVMAVVDFFSFDRARLRSDRLVVWGLVTPIYYFVFSMLLASRGVDFKGSSFPYFFLDYQTNTWFSIGGGRFGVFYWIVIVFLLVMGIGTVLRGFRQREFS